ncbi:helix-turn-helix transcriptional regulator [Listeria welshimeri]|uniref:helix-turn-helix domain-containing protein n=1 Tax=Listeria welshimeri TaxID=1643 RepID=UPI00162318D4|nr:helix-turn-helix transcriptional regulator [Listeria welshimeri]MBC1405964.1 helix-turn-helix transcriptional regulator [Listeria welshimeri]MBC1446631.1 helix-turn-helix transcriptional regulator [Listeria welshimeri]MBC1466510.1 helix-turn-helix transcriptional regulator [Listeria welshimeri]MBC1608109.1 helix-turn-helix transcriptional regulator [Listeria welshimeri]MBC1625488.1 helix-turn-helix transcriptional regulator [Listeria welshimeri]
MSKLSERLKVLRNKKKITQQTIADLVGVNRATYTNWENGKREPELDKVVELATELNSTVDYLLGNSDINYLDITENELKNLSTEEAKILSDEIKKNLFAIFDIGKNKFNMTNEEMEIMKVLVIKQFLKEAEEEKEKDRNDSSNP